MVTNVELREHVRGIEASISTDERLDDPNYWIWSHSSMEWKLNLKIFIQTWIYIYRADIVEQLTESLSFSEAMSLNIDGIMKDNEALRIEVDKVLKEK